MEDTNPETPASWPLWATGAVHTGRAGGPGNSPRTHSHRYLSHRPPSSDTARGGHPGWRALPGTLGGAPEKPGEAGSIGHLRTAASTLEGSPSLRHRPGPESAPELPGGSALCQGAGPTHLNEIKAGQEGDTVLDHFALWPLLRRHPGRLPGSASSPGRGVHSAARRAASSSRKRPARLMSHSPRAPLEPARCVQRRRLSPPLFAATRRPQSPQGPFPPLLRSRSPIFSRRDVQLPPPNCCCNGFPFLPPFPRSPPPLLGFRAVGT